MTLSKPQILNNLIKYGVIQKSQYKRLLHYTKRADLIALMNKSLPEATVKEIYNYEFCMDEKDKDYSPIASHLETRIQSKISKLNKNKPLIDQIEFKTVAKPEVKPIVVRQQEVKEEPKVNMAEEIFKFTSKVSYKHELKKRKDIASKITEQQVQAVLDRIKELY